MVVVGDGVEDEERRTTVTNDVRKLCDGDENTGRSSARLARTK
jgi:hypothetical protein